MVFARTGIYKKCSLAFLRLSSNPSLEPRPLEGMGTLTVQ